MSVAFGITVATSQQGSNPTNDSVCMTPSCVKLAASVLSSMNESVDPCQDFYNFTCGGWNDDNIVPPGMLCIYACMEEMVCVGSECSSATCTSTVVIV